MTDPGRDTTKVLLSEPMGLLGLFIRVWARVYLQNQNVSNTAVSLKPTPSLITTHKSWNPAALTERLANTSAGRKMSFTGSSGGLILLSEVCLYLYLLGSLLGWFKNTFWQSLLIIKLEKGGT